MPESNQKVVTCAQLRRQAVADLVSKEVRNGYTLTYVWMANQLGHFALGFLFTFVLVWSISLFVECPPGVWVVRIGVALFVAFSLLELYDYVIARNDAKGNPFDFDGWDILRDAVTAVAFFAFGVLAACVSVQSTRWALVVLGVGLVLSLLPARYWLARKYCFQRATMPYQFRLADFDGQLGNGSANVRLINDFWQGKGHCRHLLVFGATGTGRTTLAVGILTEHCFKVHRGRYMTWAKFIENAQMTPGEQEEMKVWPWQTSDIVVLDDVVGVVGGQAINTPAMVAGVLQQLPPAQQLRDRRTVWVLGPANHTQVQAWIAELATALQESPACFCYVSLNAPVAKRRRRYLSSFLGH